MKWLAQGCVTPVFQALSPRIAVMISAVRTNTLGQHWLQAVCRHVLHCLNILRMLTMIYSSIHSTTHVWILLNEIRHTWDFGSLWALLEIWESFIESPPKPDCSKHPWLLIGHQENICTLIIYAHMCTTDTETYNPRWKSPNESSCLAEFDELWTWEREITVINKKCFQKGVRHSVSPWRCSIFHLPLDFY